MPSQTQLFKQAAVTLVCFLLVYDFWSHFHKVGRDSEGAAGFVFEIL